MLQKKEFVFLKQLPGDADAPGLTQTLENHASWGAGQMCSLGKPALPNV